MKKTAITLMLAALTAPAFAADIPNKAVAEAIKSLTDSEKATYERLIASREKTHGCKTGTDLKNDPALIPTVDYFQTIVGIAFRALDGGKYAAALDPTLASKAGSMPAEQVADILHAYADLSRTTYTKAVVARAKASKCSTATEEWAEENGLPLPAQFTRAVAEGVRKSGKFTYSLQSEWPINKQNTAKTDFEKKAIKATQNGKPLYSEEVLGGKKYFAAAYADIAIDNTCTSCHNDHSDSPKKDFKLQDIMGDMIVRIPLN